MCACRLQQGPVDPYIESCRDGLANPAGRPESSSQLINQTVNFVFHGRTATVAAAGADKRERGRGMQREVEIKKSHTIYFVPSLTRFPPAGKKPGRPS